MNHADEIYYEDTITDEEKARVAEAMTAPIMVSYSLDVMVTCEYVVVMADDMYTCDHCGEEQIAGELQFREPSDCEASDGHEWARVHEIDKYESNNIELRHENWKSNTRNHHVPHHLGDVFDNIDISEPDVDDWCGEYITEVVTANVTFDPVTEPDKLESLERFYEDWGGIWGEYGLPLVDTMGILSADGIWPAKCVESISEGWEPDPVLAGSLYISDPRLFIQVAPAEQRPADEARIAAQEARQAVWDAESAERQAKWDAQEAESKARREAEEEHKEQANIDAAKAAIAALPHCTDCMGEPS